MGYRYKMAGILSALTVAGAVIFSACDANACSRALNSDNGIAILDGRNMDWPDTFNGTDLWLLPRGMQRESQSTGKHLSWTSKYASISAVTYMDKEKHAAVADGMNEKGLIANMLWLSDSDYGKRDPSVSGLGMSMWAQYVLDNFSTVDEAVKVLENPPYQLETLAIPVNGVILGANLHLALADKTGDSAIIEYANGKAVVHHGREFITMTNDPTYDKQLENDSFGGTKPLPGTINADDRFVRVSYYLKKLPKPKTLRQALAHTFSIMRNAAQPFSTVKDVMHPNSSATQWTTVGDLTNGTYYLLTATSPNIIWANFSEFKLDELTAPLKLDLSGDPDYIGDASGKFVKAELFNFLPVPEEKAAK